MLSYFQLTCLFFWVLLGIILFHILDRCSQLHKISESACFKSLLELKYIDI
jgi:hypothetical protein